MSRASLRIPRTASTQLRYRTSSRPPTIGFWIRAHTTMADAPPPPQLRLNNCVIFVCDLQEKFRSAIYEFDKVVLTTRKVLRAAAALQIPIYATTQNRARLGDTVPEVAAHLTPPLCRAVADKTLFSMWIPALVHQLPEPRAPQPQSRAQPLLAPGTPQAPPPQARPADIVLVGIESHICITQTALDARAAGHRVYVLADAVSSCNPHEVPLALARLRAEPGIVVTSSESWLYELVGDAAGPGFRALIGIVKDTAPDTKAALAALLPVVPQAQAQGQPQAQGQGQGVGGGSGGSRI